MLYVVSDSEDRIFHVYFEKSMAVTTRNYGDALALCFSLFFILNIQYPKQVSSTLEFIQSYYLKIYPDVGSRSTITKSKQKILGLLKKLQNFE